MLGKNSKKQLSRPAFFFSALLIFGAIAPFHVWAEVNQSYDAKKVEDRYASITWSDVIKSGPNYTGYYAYTYYDPFGHRRGGSDFFHKRGGRGFSVSVFEEIES